MENSNKFPGILFELPMGTWISGISEERTRNELAGYDNQPKDEPQKQRIHGLAPFGVNFQKWRSRAMQDRLHIVRLQMGFLIASTGKCRLSTMCEVNGSLDMTADCDGNFKQGLVVPSVPVCKDMVERLLSSLLTPSWSFIITGNGELVTGKPGMPDVAFGDKYDPQRNRAS
jgi:hypothetical protein